MWLLNKHHAGQIAPIIATVFRPWYNIIINFGFSQTLANDILARAGKESSFNHGLKPRGNCFELSHYR